jgi:hypothetical protein
MAETTNGVDAAAHGGERVQARMQRIFRRRLRTLEAAQRYSAFARTRAGESGAEAALAEAELEAEQQSADPDGRRHASFWLSVLAAAIFAGLDGWPAWWAAEALGGGYLETGVVAALLVAGLTGFATLLSYFRHRGETLKFRFAFAAAALLVAIETGLRFDYLRVTTDDGLISISIEAGLLALVTAGLLWMSYEVLLRAEPFQLNRLRRHTRALSKRAGEARKEADRAEKQVWQEAVALDVADHGRQEMYETLMLTVADTRAVTARTPANGSAPEAA